MRWCWRYRTATDATSTHSCTKAQGLSAATAAPSDNLSGLAIGAAKGTTSTITDAFSSTAQALVKGADAIKVEAVTLSSGATTRTAPKDFNAMATVVSSDTDPDFKEL